MKKITTIIIFILNGLIVLSQNNETFLIPKQKLNVFKLIGDTSKIIYGDNFTITRKEIPSLELEVNSFEISSQITLKEYKKYLNSIKRDSSFSFYKSQLPDSSIFPEPIYQKYLSDKYFEKYAVIGISWDNAMNFCKWKTFQENDEDSIRFIYRLPYLSEWLSAYQYFRTKLNKNLNIDYADWLLNTKDNQSLYQDSIDFDYFYIYENNDNNPVLLRKWVCGNNWRYKDKFPIDYFRLLNFYSFKGYDYVSFRFVRYIINEKTFIKDKQRNIYPIEYWILDRWKNEYNP